MSDMQLLPLDEWENTKITLHLYLQIIGKIRAKLHPKKNHWWHVTFYPTVRGLTTGPIPYADKLFSISFDFLNHVLIINTSDNQLKSIALGELSVAQFYKAVFDVLKEFKINVSIYTQPFDESKVMSNIPFNQDEKHCTYDKDYVTRYWKTLVEIYPIFVKFSGTTFLKTTPIQLYWHSFDLVLTFFSGKKAPVIEGMDPVSKEAYSHEVISFGYWPGDSNIREPAFYSYTYPEPERLNEQLLKPDTAFWLKANGNHMALYKYHDWLKNEDRHKALLDFLQSAFIAGSTLANWSNK